MGKYVLGIKISDPTLDPIPGDEGPMQERHSRIEFQAKNDQVAVAQADGDFSDLCESDTRCGKTIIANLWFVDAGGERRCVKRYSSIISRI